MSEFDYTKEFVVNSSVIDSVYFNENDNTVVLDVNDELYQYSGVSADDITDLVRGAGTNESVGTHYNTVFKKVHGPGDHLGFYEDFFPNRVSVVKDQTTATTPKGLYSVVDGYQVAEPTKEFSIQPPAAPVFDHAVSGSPIAPTREYSLATPLSVVPDKGQEAVGDVEFTVTVFFGLDGVEGKTFEFEAESVDIDDAIEEVHTYVSRLGVTGKVKKVVYDFE